MYSVEMKILGWLFSRNKRNTLYWVNTNICVTMTKHLMFRHYIHPQKSLVLSPLLAKILPFFPAPHLFFFQSPSFSTATVLSLCRSVSELSVLPYILSPIEIHSRREECAQACDHNLSVIFLRRTLHSFRWAITVQNRTWRFLIYKTKTKCKKKKNKRVKEEISKTRNY